MVAGSISPTSVEETSISYVAVVAAEDKNREREMGGLYAPSE